MIEYGVDGIITDYPKVQNICKSKNICFKKFLEDLKLVFFCVSSLMAKKNIKETGWKENWMNTTILWS